MYIKKYLQKRMYTSILTITVLLITLISSSQAIFMDVKTDTSDQVLTVGDLQITYTGGSAINLNGITPETDVQAYANPNDVYTFTIDNTGGVPYKYTIYLENNPSYPNNLLNHNYIRYDLNNSGKNILGTKTEGILLEGTLKPGEAKLYNLRIWVGIEGLPNEAIGKEVHLNIMVDGKAGILTLGDLILAQGGGATAISAKGNPNFAAIATATDTGLYATEDEYGTSYYYRGLKDNLNNNLIFAGFQWKIVRINGDGSIRIIYNGKCPNNTCTINNTHANTDLGATSILNTGTTYTHAWNATNAGDAKYVGYMYGGTNGSASGTKTDAQTNTTNTNAKTVLDAWYVSSIVSQGANITSKIVDNIYCNDRQSSTVSTSLDNGGGYGTVTTYYGALYRLVTNKIPTLKCTNKNDRFTVSETTIGNGALTYPVGLISADEVSMAGLVYPTSNTTNYLYTNQIYLTFSPNGFSISAGMWVVGSSGYLNPSNVFTASGLRPILNLNSETTISEGDGSTGNPFVVSD